MKHFAPAIQENASAVFFFLIPDFQTFQSFTYTAVLLIVALLQRFKPGKIHKYLFTFAH